MTGSDENVGPALDRGVSTSVLNADSPAAETSVTPPTGSPGRMDVAVIDSHSLTRECIANSISYLFANSRVFSFLSVAECCSRQADLFSLIILYLHAAEQKPLEQVRSVRAAHGHSSVFVISDAEHESSPAFIRAAWRLGARGFVSTKTTGLTLALSAIRFVQAGGFFAPVDVMLTQAGPLQKPLPAHPAAAELTARETVVLGLLKQGKTNKVIAKELRLSDNTVKVHVHNILRKMQVSNRAEAASIIRPVGGLEAGAGLIISQGLPEVPRQSPPVSPPHDVAGLDFAVEEDRSSPSAVPVMIGRNPSLDERHHAKAEMSGHLGKAAPFADASIAGAGTAGTLVGSGA